MIKTLIASCMCGLWVYAAPIQTGEGMKIAGKTNTTKSPAQNKMTFKPTVNRQSAEMKYTAPYYPRGTIATH